MCSGLGPNEEIIDDMENNSQFIPNVHGRAGAWQVFHDIASAGATIWPPDGTFPMSNAGDPCRLLAARIYGGTFTMFAGFEVGLGGPYNASAYKGVSFWAKVGRMSTPYVRISFPDKNTDPAGGICSLVQGSPNQCYDYFTKPLAFTTAWAKYTVRFTELGQLGFGNRASQLDPSTLFRLEWDIAANATFDVWVDDVAFLTQ